MEKLTYEDILKANEYYKWHSFRRRNWYISDEDDDRMEGELSYNPAKVYQQYKDTLKKVKKGSVKTKYNDFVPNVMYGMNYDHTWELNAVIDIFYNELSSRVGAIDKVSEIALRCIIGNDLPKERTLDKNEFYFCFAMESDRWHYFLYNVEEYMNKLEAIVALMRNKQEVS